jgi:hypothetical protein
LNGTVFSLVPHPENPPTHMFCKDGFHPATLGQALIAGLAVQSISFAALRVEDSVTLAADWDTVPPARITIAPDGGWSIAPLGPRRFYRLAAEPLP